MCDAVVAQCVDLVVGEVEECSWVESWWEEVSRVLVSGRDLGKCLLWPRDIGLGGQSGYLFMMGC